MKKEQNNSGFKVPEGYFRTFTDRLLNTLKTANTHLPEVDGFVIPEGYFEDFNLRLQQQLAVPDTKVRPLYHYKNFFMAAASIAAVVLLLFALPWNRQQRPTFDELAGSAIETYLQNGEFDFTNDEIAQLLPIQELELNDMMESRLREENIMEYLDASVDNYEELNIEIDD